MHLGLGQRRLAALGRFEAVEVVAVVAVEADEVSTRVATAPALLVEGRPPVGIVAAFPLLHVLLTGAALGRFDAVQLVAVVAVQTRDKVTVLASGPAL